MFENCHGCALTSDYCVCFLLFAAPCLASLRLRLAFLACLGLVLAARREGEQEQEQEQDGGRSIEEVVLVLVAPDAACCRLLQLEGREEGAPHGHSTSAVSAADANVLLFLLVLLPLLPLLPLLVVLVGKGVEVAALAVLAVPGHRLRAPRRTRG